MKRLTITSPAMTRISLLIIAFSLAVVTVALNLSAYLTGQAEFSNTFEVGGGNPLGLTFKTDAYDSTELIYPGDVVTFDPTITRGTIPCYVFVNYTKVGKIEPDVNLSSWKQLEGSTVYYYSNGSNKIAEFPAGEEGVAFINSVTIPEEDEVGDSGSISLTAYGIQTKNMDEYSAAELARMAGAIKP